MLADMATSLEASRGLIWQAASAYDQGLKKASMLSAMAKLILLLARCQS